MVVKRAGPGIMRVKEMGMPLQAATLRRVGSAPHLGSRVKLALVVGGCW